MEPIRVKNRPRFTAAVRGLSVDASTALEPAPAGLTAGQRIHVDRKATGPHAGGWGIYHRDGGRAADVRGFRDSPRRHHNG